MIERYLIRDLIYQGYFSIEHNGFRGIIFASQFITEQDAKDTIEARLTAGTYEIVKTYRR
jgi:hypothetical protein